MVLRLSLDFIDGFKELPRKKRNEIVSENMKNSFKHYQTWIGLAIICIGSLAGQGIGYLFGGETIRMILGLLGIIIGTVVFVHMFNTQIAPYVETSIQYYKDSTS